MMFYNPYFYMPPFIPANCDKPPTLYSILESIVNYGKPEKTKIKNLAKESREKVFDFYYPLSENVSRETFEEMILNRFLMRRIGFDTFTAFQIQLNVTLNAIMPIYNKMFDLLSETNFVGDTQIREGFDNTTGNTQSSNSSTLENTSQNNTKNTSDRRFSDTPENRIGDVQAGKYITDYNYDTNTANSDDKSTSIGSGSSNENRNDNRTYKETITNVNAIDQLLKINEKRADIYSLIFKDLEPLFYQII